MILVVPPVSEKSAPSSGAEGGEPRPAAPQLVVPGMLVKARLFAGGALVVVVVPRIVLEVTIVVEVVVGHGSDDGWHSRVTFCAELFGTFADTTHLPIFLPCFLVRTVTPANAPHTEVVPLALTLTLPTGPQCPLA